uniref:LIM zinc-binding domain-containing protein n=1 Tax=Caenorhabditis tropicalis TaxID=1561998 RepID=A0A1I7TZQ8_9PELO
MDPCHTCNKDILIEELTFAFDRKWHRSCFRCAFCKEILDYEGPVVESDKVYCELCHDILYKPEYYGYMQMMFDLCSSIWKGTYHL